MKKENSRRSFIKKSALISLAGAGLHLAGNTVFAGNLFEHETELFKLPLLPYPEDALEPHFDTLTMQIHHGKHHKAYVDNLNKAVSEAQLDNTKLMDIFSSISKHSPAMRNNAGGHFNHSMFWKLLKPKGGGEPTGDIGTIIIQTFGSFEAFKEKFNAAATGRFGSGWAWLVIKKGKLEIGSTPNQDNPLMDVSEFTGSPLLALDVWEHAYYLKYQNKRADYINAFWNLVNWDEVNSLLLKSRKDQ